MFWTELNWTAVFNIHTVLGFWASVRFSLSLLTRTVEISWEEACRIQTPFAYKSVWMTNIHCTFSLCLHASPLWMDLLNIYVFYTLQNLKCWLFFLSGMITHIIIKTNWNRRKTGLPKHSHCWHAYTVLQTFHLINPPVWLMQPHSFLHKNIFWCLRQ